MLPNLHQLCAGERKEASLPSWSFCSCFFCHSLKGNSLGKALGQCGIDLCGLQGFRGASASPLKAGVKLLLKWKESTNKAVQELGSLFPASP